MTRDRWRAALLVANRPRVPDRAQRGPDSQAAATIEREPPHAGVGEADPIDARPWGDVEFILEPAVVATEDEVDPRPEVVLDDLPVGGHVRSPLRAVAPAQVVDPAELAPLSGDYNVGVGADEAEPEGEARLPVPRE